MSSTIATAGRKTATWMVAVLLILGVGALVAKIAINAKASSAVASVKVSFDGKDVVTVADARAYSNAVLDKALAAESTATAQTDTLLAQREAFQKADTLSKMAGFAGTAYRACLVVGAILMLGLTGGIAMRTRTRRPRGRHAAIKAAAC